MSAAVDPTTPNAWSFAVPDWAERLERGASLLPDLPLFEAPATKALEIFKRLRVPDMIGDDGPPMMGDVAGTWILDLVRTMFGAYNPETRESMIKDVFVAVPKKNFKSGLSCGVILTAAILNERPQAEMLLIGPSQKISGRLFRTLCGMIRADATLKSLFHIREHLGKIEHRITGATIEILSADGDVVTGTTASFIVVDETHVLGTKEKAAGIFEELRGGPGSRPEGFLLQITTQSKKPPSGQWRKELQTARDVRDGKIHLPWLSLIYELPQQHLENERWKDPKLWPLVNPNLGRSVTIETLQDRFTKAEGEGLDAMKLFASLRLNVEVGGTALGDNWVGAHYWDGAVAEDVASLEDLIAVSEVIVGGLDGGGLDDLLGLSFVGRRPDRRWVSWSAAWCHPIALERHKQNAPFYQDLADAGELTICQEVGQDLAEVVALVCQVKEAGLFPEKAAFGLDPAGVAALVDALIEAGVTEDQLQAVSQGWKLNGAIKGAERKLFERSLQPADQPLMIWAVGNAKTEQRGNAVVATKAASGAGKIDPLMALFNGVTLMALNPVAKPKPDLDGFLRAQVMAA